MIAGLFPLCLVVMTTTTARQGGDCQQNIRRVAAAICAYLQSRACQACTATDASTSHTDDAPGAALSCAPSLLSSSLQLLLPTLYIHSYMPVYICYTRCYC